MQDLYTYIKKHIWRYSAKARNAVNEIAITKYPLSLAAPKLYDEITEKINEWCEMTDNCAYDYDTEDTFWEL